MFCPRCGQQMPDGSQFCLRCGQPLGAVQQAIGPPGSQQGMPPQGWPGYPTRTGQGNGYQPGWGQVPGYGQNLVPPQRTQARQEMPAQAPKPKPKQEQKTLVPDPTFSKFVEAPDPPLPFHVPKIIFGVISILAAGLLMWECNSMGTFRLIAGHAKDNIPGLSLLAVAIILIVAGVLSAVSKMSKGAAGAAAVLYFFACGFAITNNDEYEYFLVYAICAAIFAIVDLVSAAGGVNIHLDD